MALAEQPPHVDTSSYTPANATDLKAQGAQMNGGHGNGEIPHPKMTFQSNWTTFDEPSLSRESLTELFANNIPAVRHKKLLTPEECAKMAEITKAFKLVSDQSHFGSLWEKAIIRGVMETSIRLGQVQ